ncbi:hypothetical protein BDZ89DRAFT_1044800 [Hymenopellis radicata]|nr:hypothetical protein BDZ89DRAFT_1044800 [Hymenopellis radicata]
MPDAVASTAGFKSLFLRTTSSAHSALTRLPYTDAHPSCSTQSAAVDIVNEQAILIGPGSGNPSFPLTTTTAFGSRSPSCPRLSSASSSAPVFTTTLILSQARHASKKCECPPGCLPPGTRDPEADTRTRVDTRAGTLFECSKHSALKCRVRVHPGAHLSTRHSRPRLDKMDPKGIEPVKSDLDHRMIYGLKLSIHTPVQYTHYLSERPQRVRRESDSRLVTRVLRQNEVQFRLASDSTRDDSRVIASPLASTHHESESSRILESGEDGREVREVVMGNGGGGGGCGVDTSSHIIRPLTSSSSSCCILLLLLLIAVHLGRRVIAIIVEYCPLAGAYASRPRFHEDDVKSSSASVVVADLKSSDGSRPQDLLLAQSQQQQARHRARAKSTPHRLPDNRQSSGSDNRHSLGSRGGRGGGSEERNNTRSDADASLRDSARIAGSGRIIVHVSFSRRCGPFALQKIRKFSLNIDLNICESSCDDSCSENQYSDSCSDSRRGTPLNRPFSIEDLAPVLRHISVRVLRLRRFSLSASIAEEVYHVVHRAVIPYVPAKLVPGYRSVPFCLGDLTDTISRLVEPWWLGDQVILPRVCGVCLRNRQGVLRRPTEESPMGYCAPELSSFPSLLFTIAGWTSLASQFPNCSVIQAINGDLKPLDRSVDPHSNNGLAMFAFHLRAFIACLLSEIGLDPCHKACHVHNILQPLCVITNRGVDIAYPALPAGHALFRSDLKGKAASAKANVSAVLIDETLEAVGDKLVGDIDMDNGEDSDEEVVIDQKDRALSSSYWADKPNKANAPVRSVIYLPYACLPGMLISSSAFQKAADTLGAPSESNEPAPKRKAGQQELSRRAKKMAKALHILVEPVVLDQFTQAVSCTDSFRRAMQQVHRSLERLNDFNDSLSAYLGEDALRQAELQYRYELIRLLHSIVGDISAFNKFRDLHMAAVNGIMG